MFDTLDIMISFIIVIFILSLLVQSLQSILKRLFRMKTRQAVNYARDIFGSLQGALPLEAIQKELGVLEKKMRVPELDAASMETLIGKIMDLGAVKDHLKGEPTALENVKSAALDRLAQDVDLVKEHYVSSMKHLSLLLAVFVSLALNADSLQMIEKISSDKTVRQIIVQTNYIQQTLRPPTRKPVHSSGASSARESIKSDLADISLLAREYEGLNIGIKWSSTTDDFSSLADKRERILFILKKLVGILITAVLVSMGAPFWHDILQAMFSLKDRLKNSE